ncbi:MAG TPA: methyl-accepting chemotaxis protein, partial [Pseudobdellovibrionaceae bacterium]|nr:methyl-accepting chemotaxis protein [Pseudobdellovibrionaceae bacterium]
MFKRFGIGKSLMLYVTCSSLIVFFVGGAFYMASQKVVKELTETSDEGMKGLQLSTSLVKSMALIHSNILPVPTEKDKDSREIRLELIKGFIAEFDSLIKKCGESCTKANDDFLKYQANWNKILADHIMKDDLGPAMTQIMDKLNPIAESIFDKLDKIASETGKAAAAKFLVAEEQSKKTKQILFGMIFALVATIFAVGYAFQKVLVKLIDQVVRHVHSSVEKTTDRTSEIHQSADNLSNSSTKQAAAIEETVASITELSSMVDRNAGHAKQAADLAQQSSMAAESGGQEINLLINSMKDVSDSSKKIEEIIGVIDDIAF